jgi:hypothetical protein
MEPTTENPKVSPIHQIEALYDRLTRARTLVADNKVHPVYGMADHYIVEGTEAKYLVNGNCICPDATNRPEIKGLCKHKLAALIVAEQAANADNPKVAKATRKAKTEAAPPETDPDLEQQIAELYH